MRCVHLAIFATFISIALAHGDHSNEQERLGTTDDWATRHMQGKLLLLLPTGLN